MNAPASFTAPYFMTPHRANLMEDLHRQIVSDASICLVYGTKGAGKTQMIKQFIGSRLKGRDVTNCTVVEGGFKLEGDKQARAFDCIQSTLLRQQSNHSIWVVDQVEQSPDSFIQQLLRFWTLQSENQSATLILCCRSEHLPVVYEVTEQLKIKIPSVELKPLNQSESIQYLSVHLCPQVDSHPRLNADLKRQVKSAGGIPELLDQIILRNKGQVRCTHDIDKSDRVRAFSVVAVALVLVIFTLMATNDQMISSMSFSQTEDRDKLSQPLNEVEIVAHPPQVPVTNTDSTAEQVLEESANVEARPVSEAHTDLKLDLAAPVEEGPGRSKPVQAEAQVNLLQQRLRATREWLEQSSDETSSIQIMSLTFGARAEEPLITFLQRLSTKGIEIQQVYIYLVEKPAKQIYVVLFGDFDSSSEALQQLSSLPPSFKANSPLIRTVRSIKKEINGSKNQLAEKFTD